MRIALVSQEYPPDTAHGGIATQTHAKAVGLTSLGHEVHVITRSPDGTRRDLEDVGVSVHRLPGEHEWSLLTTDVAQWIAWSTDVATELSRLHQSCGLDVVDVPEYGAEGYVHLLNRSEWSTVPTVVHLHGPLGMLARTLGWPDRDSELLRIGTHMEQTCLRLADAVISSSNCSAMWCERLYGIDARTVPVVHSGVDTNLFLPADGRAGARPTVVFVGRLASSKGVESLVSACCVLAQEVSDLSVKLIGRGDDKVVRRLRDAARSAGFPELLQLCGHLPHEALAAELAGADVFAAPSAYEGGPGLVYLEAMACGLPVIACAGSGASEVVLHDVTGLTVPPGDEAALVTALRRTLGPEGRNWGAAGRRMAVEQHDTRRCLRTLESVYRSVCGAASMDGQER